MVSLPPFSRSFFFHLYSDRLLWSLYFCSTCQLMPPPISNKCERSMIFLVVARSDVFTSPPSSLPCACSVRKPIRLLRCSSRAISFFISSWRFIEALVSVSPSLMYSWVSALILAWLFSSSVLGWVVVVVVFPPSPLISVFT